MPKVSTIQNNFGAGEFSPLLNGRSDVKRYKQGLAKCLNYAPTIQGGLTRRSGTKFINELSSGTAGFRLVPFVIDSETTYHLLFRDGLNSARVYEDRVDVGSFTHVSFPDVSKIDYAQTPEGLFIVDGTRKPQLIVNDGSATLWTVGNFAFVGGPWLSLNNTATTATPAGTTGTVNVTFSSVTGINNGGGFTTSDLLRLIRYKPTSGAAWGYGQIVGVTSGVLVSVTIADTLAGTAASGFWQLGVYSQDFYPSSVEFHDSRVFYSGVARNPDHIDASRVDDYVNFYPSENDGSVTAIHGLSFALNSVELNIVKWMLSSSKGLILGTSSGEWLIKPSNNSAALSPSDITAKKHTSWGSASVGALAVGRDAVFIQKSGRKLRELRYFFDVDGLNSEDLTVLAEHISETGIISIAYQKTPQPVVWMVRTDGMLIGVTYERSQDAFKVGWHRHTIGGVSDAAGSPAKVKEVSVIESVDGSRDEVWVVVQRYIDGATVQQMEYITPEFEDTIEQKDAFFVDSGLTYDDPKTISAATKADPGVITATSHGFSDGDKVLISDVLGMTELNTNSYLVANKTTHTFELTDLLGADIDTTGFTVYVSGGEVRKYVTTISGLTHLEGEEVAILADGAVQPDKTVSSGAITLTESATTVHVGFGYNSDAKLLRAEAGAADGTSFGKTRRTNRIGIMFHRSLGLKVGFSFDDLTQLTFRKSSDPLSRAVPLFTGIESYQVDADYDFENQFCFRQDQPLPSIILAIMPQMHVMDR